MPQRQRPRRVAVRGARIQFANTPADVMNVSRTGALIRLGYHLRTGGEWPLVLELPAFEPVWLTGREVMKDVSHHYSCRQCGRPFAGFRVGPLRLSF